MKHCLNLALHGMGRVSPNPMVGAVLVKKGKIIGQGFHTCFGQAHAEIEALRTCRRAGALGATLYVNMEPCAHTGNTPPCTDAILKSGVSRVVVGMIDPNPLVAGKGVEFLRKSGLVVIVGVLEQECRNINRIFSHWITVRKPYIIAKAATSADWKIAARRGERTQITGPEQVRKVHELRQLCDAILVGVDTVIIDDPLLTVRGKRKASVHNDDYDDAFKQPIRIILDSYIRIPLDAHVLADTNVFIATTEKFDRNKRLALLQKGIHCHIFPKGTRGVDISCVLEYCGSRDITSILVEGGAKVFDSFIEANLVNEWQVFQSDSTFGPLGVDVCSDVSMLADRIATQKG